MYTLRHINGAFSQVMACLWHIIQCNGTLEKGVVMKAKRIIGTGSGLLMSLILACALAFAAATLLAPKALAEAGEGSSGGLTAIAPLETSQDVTVGDFKYRIYSDDKGNPTSIMIMQYTGNATELILPTSFDYDGKTYPGATGEMLVGDNAFAGNTMLEKVAIPDGYGAISNGAFSGCTGLTEVAIGNSVEWIGDDAFTGCSNLKTYLINPAEAYAGQNCGIGVDADGNAYAGVTVYVVEGSSIISYIEALNDKGGNQITVEIVDDPYSMSTVTPPSPIDPPTPYSPGASASDADEALTHYVAEIDPEGTVYRILQAKVKKVTKNSLTLSWMKNKKAKKYVVYGNICGKRPLKKLFTAKKGTITSKKLTKIAGKNVKAGTYYKFVVVALNKNKKVISTSKLVHAVTNGSKKYCNDKKVTTAAKKNKVTIKKGKTFNLKAKAIPAVKGKTVRQHRKVAYESSKAKIATVGKKGVIKGRKKGTCFVYAFAQNGLCAKVKVTVK